MANDSQHKSIYVYAYWISKYTPALLGTLNVDITRGREIYSFEYNNEWLESGFAQVLDPDLGLYSGRQYIRDDKTNFGLFLDSAPDRWGRLLMKRHEAAQARAENRLNNKLYESDYLLGVYDGHRMGALRFKLDIEGEFKDDNRRDASPQWASLRDLEYASLQLEKEDLAEDSEYLTWLYMLLVPGSSLGGARPKSSVVDQNGELWIAKFPSSVDQFNVGAWEKVVHQLAVNSGINTSEARIQKFSSDHDTFLTKRFDRTPTGDRIHFASALTMLGYKYGVSFSDGASYLELAEFLIQFGARVNEDLEELWRRIVFYICVSNTDDHLRNHGFILEDDGWILAPAYDINPVESGTGLSLNISEDDNSLDLDLAIEVAEYFRVNPDRTNEIIDQVRDSVNQWRIIARKYGISNLEQDLMSRAFQAIN